MQFFLKNAPAAAALMLLAACAPEDTETTSAEVEEVSAAGLDEDKGAGEHKEPSPNALQPVDNSARAVPPPPDADDEAEMRWTFSRSADRPSLAFGEPRTDNVRLMIRCGRNEEAHLSFIRPAEIVAERPHMMTIASGGATRSLTLETRPGQLGTTVEVQAPLAAAPLQQFRSGRDLRLRWGDEEIRVPGGSDGPVEEFFAACG